MLAFTRPKLLCCVDRQCYLSLAERKECPSTLGPHVPPTEEWVLTQLLDKSQLGSPDRVREKITKLIQSKQEVEQRLQDVETRAKEAEQKLQTSEEALRGRIKEAESRAQEAERRVEQLQHEKEGERRL